MGRHHGKFDRPPMIPAAEGEVYGFRALQEVEQTFFTQFSDKIYMVYPDDITIERDLLDRIKEFWKYLCFSPEKTNNFINDKYIGTFGWGMPDDKKIESIHIHVGAKTRKTNIVRLNIIAITVVDNTACIIYEYSWDFFDDKGNRLLETGRLNETWVKQDKLWTLLTDSGGPLE